MDTNKAIKWSAAKWRPHSDAGPEREHEPCHYRLQPIRSASLGANAVARLGVTSLPASCCSSALGARTWVCAFSGSTRAATCCKYLHVAGGVAEQAERAERGDKQQATGCWPGRWQRWQRWQRSRRGRVLFRFVLVCCALFCSVVRRCERANTAAPSNFGGVLLPQSRRRRPASERQRTPANSSEGQRRAATATATRQTSAGAGGRGCGGAASGELGAAQNTAPGCEPQWARACARRGHLWRRRFDSQQQRPGRAATVVAQI